MPNTASIQANSDTSGCRDAPSAAPTVNVDRSPAAAMDIVDSVLAWQLNEICHALAEADAGTFATDLEVNAFATKWGVAVKP